MKNNYPDSFTIQQYLEGKLDPERMHQLEKQALDDPFLWEALEGFSSASDPGRDLSILQRQLHERIVHLQENKKVFDLTWQRLSVAAAAAVLFITAGILFWMNSPKSPEIASGQKKVEVQLTSPDSLSSEIINSPSIASKPANEAPQSSGSRISAYKLKPSANDLKAAMLVRGDSSVSLAQARSEADRSSANQTVLSSEMAGGAAVSKRTVSKKRDSIDARNSTFSEVVITTNPQLIAQPQAGWELYRQYLEKNIRKPKNEPVMKGTVQLSLQVFRDGRIGDIKVIKGINEAYNAEAIRLVKEGPIWKGAADGLTKEVRIEIVF